MKWETGENGREKGMDKDLERDIKETLRSILSFVEADMKYAEYAQLTFWLEQLIKRNR